MVDSRIHRNMKTSRGGSAPEIRLLWLSTQQIRKYGRAVLCISTMTKDCHDELGSQFLLHRDCINSKQLGQFGLFFNFFSSFLFFLFCFWTRNYIYYTSACYVHVMKRQSKRKKLQNSESFLFGDIGLYSRYNFVNYGT